MTTNTPQWVDYHCHLDLYPDHGALAAECERQGIATLAVTTTPKAWERNLRIAERFPMIRVGLGLHPQVVAQRASELDLLLELLPSATYVGEIGLDASPAHYHSFEAQERVFASVLDACAQSGRRILSIHSVRSAPRVLKHLHERLPANRARAVLHWFTGSASDARTAVRLGCYFSVNSAMLASSRARALIQDLPHERLLTETDGPFVKNNGVPVRPAKVQDTVGGLAQLLGMAPGAAAELIVRNMQELEAFAIGGAETEPRASRARPSTLP
jgi:TatD DNase family protein